MCNICDAMAGHADAGARLTARAHVRKGTRKGPDKVKRGAGRKPRKGTVTHEEYVRAIYGIALRSRTITDADRKELASIKLTYGAGPDGTRGVTYYKRWRPAGSKEPVPFVAVCATGQSSVVQVAGTTLHELGHVLAGWGAGHQAEWLEACARLGLGTGAKNDLGGAGVKPIYAAGTEYTWENFHPAVRKLIRALPVPNEGEPVSRVMVPGVVPGQLAPAPVTLKPCGAGWGTQGGMSRGQGSGSRLLLWECACTTKTRGRPGPVRPMPFKIRHAGTELQCTCKLCGKPFKLVTSSVPKASRVDPAKLAKAGKVKGTPGVRQGHATSGRKRPGPAKLSPVGAKQPARKRDQKTRGPKS